MGGTRFPNLPLSVNDQFLLLTVALMLADLWAEELPDSPIVALVRQIAARAEHRGTSEEAA